ncbi:hypothetical protein PCE1_002711 [Barthelona sp. PCE]
MNFIRKLVSQKHHRYNDSEFNLDLTYISPKIIAMSFPASGIQSLYRNKREEVARFLESNHKDSYMIFNVSEMHYAGEEFSHNVLEFSFPDHHPPTLELLFRICRTMDQWLKAAPQNVAAVHCKAGKGRTGTVISSYMLYSMMFGTAEQSMFYFAAKRNAAFNGVAKPSQRRYVCYCEEVLQRRVLPYPVRIRLEKVLFFPVPSFDGNGCNPVLIISESFEKKLEVRSSEPFGTSDAMVTLEFEIEVEGDVLLRFNHSGLLKTNQMFRTAFHTAFLLENSESYGKGGLRMMRLTKKNLDKADHDDRFADNFRLDVFFTILERDFTEADLPPWYDTLPELRDPESTVFGSNFTPKTD